MLDIVQPGTCVDTRPVHQGVDHGLDLTQFSPKLLRPTLSYGQETKSEHQAFTV
jgi:hypothetical protein